jgi:penicillin-binding protein 2
MKGLILLPLALAGLLQSTGAGAVPRKKVASTTASRKRRPVVRRPPAVDPTIGDNADGDDPAIRQAAIAALGSVNGSVVVVDPSNGRVLTMVNQKLALKSGFIPCSTIKLVTSLAALTERVVTPTEWIYASRSATYNLTTALAHSNNQYFAALGRRLGFERVVQYAQMLGLGEKAGLDIPGEEPGTVVAAPPGGGVGMMTSFGIGFEVTPLELAALLSAIANNGTLYHLQYPRTQAEIEWFVPKVKRQLELAPNSIADIKNGMRGAVDYGTAKRANYDPNEPVFGKTGTCTDFRAGDHMGWFGSFNEVGRHQLVVVVMLAGSRAFSGPVAAGVAGGVYRRLSEERYFTADASPKKGLGLPEILTTYPCCSVAPPAVR